jgi:hypothetical protein
MPEISGEMVGQSVLYEAGKAENIQLMPLTKVADMMGFTNWPNIGLRKEGLDISFGVSFSNVTIQGKFSAFTANSFLIKGQLIS